MPSWSELADALFGSRPTGEIPLATLPGVSRDPVRPPIPLASLVEQPTMAEGWEQNARTVGDWMPDQQQADVRPIWSPDNPVGTERLRDQSVGVPRGEFDPVVGKWPTGKPMLRSEHQGIEDTSKNLFSQASMIMPGGGPGRIAAQIRGGAVRAPRGPRPPRPPATPTETLATAIADPPAAPAPAPVPAPVAPARTSNVSESGDVGGGTRGLLAVPSLRTMSPADAAVAAAAEPHIQPKPGGGYAGFPEHVRTPEDIAKMRADFDAAIDSGALGRDWYLLERKWISDITGNHYDPNTGASLTGKPGDARRVAEGLAVFSPQSTPDTNLQFYLQARNAYARGQPLTIARTGEQARKYNTAMDETEAMRQGKKTDPFSTQLSPDRPIASTGVNDTWHARVLGYKNADGTPFSGSIGEQQHIVMDHETVLAIARAEQRKAGGLTGWDAGRVQASPWVAGKEAGLRARYSKWSPERLRDTAMEGFSNAAPRSTAYMPHEQAPGASTGLEVPPGQMSPWSKAATWSDETGRDALTGPLFHMEPMKPTQGTYRNSRGELEMNPAHTARPLVDFSAKVEPREVHPGTQSALTGTTAVRGLEDMQEGSSWHYIDTRTSGVPLRDQTSMRLTGARPDEAQIARLQAIADKQGYHLADTGDGVSLIHNADSKAAPANGVELKARLQGGLQAEIEAALPGTKVAPGVHSGDYVDLTQELAEGVKGQGLATTKVLGLLDKMRTGAPRMYEATLDNPAVATKAQANLDRLTPEMRAKRSDYVQLLEIMAAGNLRGLLDRVARVGAGGLPAALLALSQGETNKQSETVK